MANALKSRGVFWWFQAEHDNTASLETSVPGALTISEEGNITLELDGPLWYENPDISLRWDVSRSLPYENKIAGRLNVSREANVLLFDLVRTDYSWPDETPQQQSYEALLCFTSDVPFSPDFNPDNLAALRIELKGLEEWLRLESIQVEEDWRDKNHTEYRVRHENQNFKYDMPEAELSIENLVLGVSPIRLSCSPERRVDIWETHWLIYTPTRQSTLVDLQRTFESIEEVIALFVGRYCRLDWPNFVNHGEFGEWYKLYSYRGLQTDDLPPWVFLWTRFDDIRQKFGDLLSHWQTNVEKYGAGYKLYVASLQDPIPQPEHRFVNLVWAIESLHRRLQRETVDSASIVGGKIKTAEVLKRFATPADKELRNWLKGKLKYAHEPTLEARIVEIFERLPLKIDPRQLRSFAARCAKRRNDISHEGGFRSDEDSGTFQTEIRRLADALHYLFHALLLHEIGIAPDVLVKAMTQSGLAERSVLPSLHAAGIDLPTGESTC